MSENAPQAPDSLSIGDVLKIRNYRLLWLAQIVSNIGDSLTFLALVLLINELTDGSASAIAGLLIVSALPSVTVGLFAGAIVDRSSRKRIMISAELLQMIFVFGFVILSLQINPPITIIYLVAFLSSAAGAFFMPARMAIIPTIVPANGLMSANSLGQISRVLFSVIGTSLAGFLVGVLGQFTLVFAIDALTFLISPLIISRIVLPEVVSAENSPVANVLADIREGIAIIVGNRILVGVMLGFAITMLGIGAINVLLPPFVVNDLAVNETWLGAVEFSQSIAMILSGLLVSTLAAKFTPTRIIGVALVGMAIVSMGFSLVSNVWHLFPLLFMAGVFMTPLQAAAATLMQTRVETEVMGRVGAALNALITLASLISMFAAGYLADNLGIQTVFIIGGVITLIGALVAMVLFRPTHPHPA